VNTKSVTVYTYKILVLVRVCCDIRMSLLTHVNHLENTVSRLFIGIVYIISSFSKLQLDISVKIILLSNRLHTFYIFMLTSNLISFFNFFIFSWKNLKPSW